MEVEDRQRMGMTPDVTPVLVIQSMELFSHDAIAQSWFQQLTALVLNAVGQYF